MPEINLPSGELVPQEFHIPTPEEILVLTGTDFALIDQAAKTAVMSLISDLKQHYSDEKDFVIRGRMTLLPAETSEHNQLRILTKIKELMLSANWHVELYRNGNNGVFTYTIKSLKAFLEQQAANKLARQRKFKLWSFFGTVSVMAFLGLLVYFV